MLPRHGLFRAQRRFGDGILGRAAGDAAEEEFLDAGSVGGAEEGADVVQAADVVQQDRDRQRGDAVVERAGAW